MAKLTTIEGDKGRRAQAATAQSLHGLFDHRSFAHIHRDEGKGKRLPSRISHQPATESELWRSFLRQDES